MIRLALLAAGGLLVSSCAAIPGGCRTSHVYFIGYGRSVASVSRDGRDLWRGELRDRNPSNEISAIAQICLASDTSFSVLDQEGRKEFRTPSGQPPYYVVVSSKALGWPVTVDRNPPILD
jgi:hypothetical protein